MPRSVGVGTSCLGVDRIRLEALVPAALVLDGPAAAVRIAAGTSSANAVLQLVAVHAARANAGVGGIAEPHWVQKAAGGVERWHVGQRISPGLGVAMSRALCPSRPVRARPRVGWLATV